MQANGGAFSAHGPRFRWNGGEVVQVDWILSEFAAANAIIDSLCNHLKAVSGGSAAEYEAVDEAIRRRRWLWTPFVNFMHHSPITEVDNALDHVAWRRRHHRSYHHNNHYGKREFKRNDELSLKDEQKGESAMENHAKISENEPRNSDDESNVEDTENVKEVDIPKADAVSDLKDSREIEESEVENGVDACEDQNPNPNVIPEAKTFVAADICDGMTVNVVQGLKLYEEMIDRNEVSKLVSVVNDLRDAGKAGKLVGETYVVFKRPMRGHGREVFQLGVPVIDAMLDYGESAVARTKGPKVEPIPTQLQDVIDRLVDLQILTSKPDACIIDLYNEGEYSNPYIHPPWYGRPISVIFLSECDMIFGKTVSSDRMGNYRGSFKISFAPGSLILMEGQSADFANRAINAAKNQRVLVTFTKSQPGRSIFSPRSTKSSRSLSVNVFQPPLAYKTRGLVPRSFFGLHEMTYPISGTGVFIPSGSASSQPLIGLDTNLAPPKNGNCSTKFHDNESKNSRNDDVDERQ